MSDFIKGLELSELFYREAVAPLLKARFPEVPHSAALIGWGSEVLGYDDLESTDHNWGLRLQLFLSEGDDERRASGIDAALSAGLPRQFRGHSVAFPVDVNEDQRRAGESGAQLAKQNVEIETVRGFFERYLGCDPFGELRAADWLTFPEHKLLAVTSGRIFHDGLGKLEAARRKFSYYPKDVWLYLLAAQWIKIFEEQAFVGRCGFVGDELGSAVIAARQVKNLMHLCFLIERKYAPYSKWFGTAFARLNCAGELMPIFDEVMQAREWRRRQAALAKAYEVVAKMHNDLKVTIPMQEKSAQYGGRPYLVVGDERYVEELMKAFADEEVRDIKHGLGSVNQFVDSNSQLNNPFLCKKLKELYE